MSDGRTGGSGGGGDRAAFPDRLVCPTCGLPFGSHGARPGSPMPLAEPIPEKRPLAWLRVASGALAGVMLLGGAAYGAYRYGVARNASPASGDEAPRSAAATAAPSSAATSSALPSLPSTSTSSTVTTPTLGSIPSTGLPSPEDSATARFESLRERLGLGGGAGDRLSAHVPPAGGTAGGAATGAPSGPSAGELDLSIRAKLRASSTLAPARGFTYIPENLVDGRGDTCWAEGAPGYGIGQSVTYDFIREVTVTRVEVLPGYDKRNEADRWTSNGRLKTATLRFDDGAEQTVALTDSRRYQSVAVPSRRTRTLTVTIAEVYAATPGPHAAEDTSVGELRVYGR